MRNKIWSVLFAFLILIALTGNAGADENTNNTMEVIINVTNETTQAITVTMPTEATIYERDGKKYTTITIILHGYVPPPSPAIADSKNSIRDDHESVPNQHVVEFTDSSGNSVGSIQASLLPMETKEFQVEINVDMAGAQTYAVTGRESITTPTGQRISGSMYGYTIQIPIVIQQATASDTKSTDLVEDKAPTLLLQAVEQAIPTTINEQTANAESVVEDNTFIASEVLQRVEPANTTPPPIPTSTIQTVVIQTTPEQSTVPTTTPQAQGFGVVFGLISMAIIYLVRKERL